MLTISGWDGVYFCQSDSIVFERGIDKRSVVVRSHTKSSNGAKGARVRIRIRRRFFNRDEEREVNTTPILFVVSVSIF